ncbi:DUF5827 family protein [Halorientalis pallida]|uniref:Uncharacterized protein n=1 Tax=Halorientalis pallida TaxID=2479928 RepID=A0A498KWR9_9EURY|nr:DUF5827 family protein [Halorientalis pallida]RXK49376.1 hypothetical protein EAF64_10710 [Halorientalis pallida]
MPVPKSEFDDLRSLEFRDPEEVLDENEMYTVYEIARLFQGLEPGQDLDPATEDILLDWTIPWMLDNSEAFVFAEPADDDEPGHYGLATAGTAGSTGGGTGEE